MSLLLLFSLVLQLGAPSPGQSGSAASIPLKTYQVEIGFLHHALDRQALRVLLVWDPKGTAQSDDTSPFELFARKPEPLCARHAPGLRDARAAERIDDSTPVMVLHFFATWCEPCKEEFAVWREVGRRIANQSRGRVRIAHIALQEDAEGMAKLESELSERLPSGRIYFDCEGRLMRDLRQARMDGRAPSLPLTLWLDGERIVRQAMVGPITSRKDEVVASTARLLALIEQQEKALLQRSLHPE